MQRLSRRILNTDFSGPVDWNCAPQPALCEGLEVRPHVRGATTVDRRVAVAEATFTCHAIVAHPHDVSELLRGNSDLVPIAWAQETGFLHATLGE